jgi:hypothetical protein
MSNYTKTVNFAAKDALTTGDANKVVKGTEIDTEFNNIATAVATKLDAGSSVSLTTGVTGVLPVANGGSGSSSGVSLTTGVTGVLPIANGGSGSSSGVSLTTGVTGVLPVANGGSGSSSGVAASIVLPGTFSTGTFTLDSSSLLRLGAASPTANWRFYSKSTGAHPAMVADMAADAFASGLTIVSTANPTSVTYVAFSTNYSTPYATISGNGTTVTYGTSSDYRLKANVTPLTGSAAKVKALKPCAYNWVNSPTTESQGFLAHELAEIVPQAVVGEKDAVNADGSIKSQQVDLSYVIPLLTAALQEAFARIEALEAA